MFILHRSLLYVNGNKQTIYKNMFFELAILDMI